MATNIIADAHIIPDHPNFTKILSFLDIPADTIILLGDTFELLVGNSSFYVKTYKPIWDKFFTLLDKNITIYYFEGNHDFHLQCFFKKLFSNYPNFHLIKDHETITICGKKYLFLHGDRLFPSKYSSFIKSKFIYILAQIFPYPLVKYIYTKINSKSYRPLFNSDALLSNLYKYPADFFIIGHLHEQLIYKNLIAIPSLKHSNAYLQITDNICFKKF